MPQLSQIYPTESLILQLFTSGLISLLLLLPLYYLLGYGTLSLANSVWHLRFKQSQRFQFEDILVAAIATLSLIIIACRVVGVFPQILLIFKLSMAIAVFCLLLGFGYSRFARIKQQFILPSWQHSFIWFFLFSSYLIRAAIKARSLGESLYIPSGFNTDIFLYIRRSIVFFGSATRTQSENNQPLVDILYNSPKLLSTLIYASFTYVIGDIAIAATIVTSLVLAGIVLKYLVLIKTEAKPEAKFGYSITTIALTVLIVCQPVWCWLQDQFYWSNLLCIYLLIYALADLFTGQKISSSYFVKLAIAMIALAGFYPSQLPFFMLAAMIGIIFNSALDNRSRQRYLLATVIITIAVACLFITQYLDTTEIATHFDISDAVHGQKLNYIPFWSFLDFMPRTGGTPKDFGAALLIAASLTVGFLVIKYCIKVVPDYANWFKLLIGLYALYSISYLILPGEYRQSKFFFTYIVALFVFCIIKVLLQVSWRRKQTVQILLSILAIYVVAKSSLKSYKPHVSSNISSAIATVNSLHKPTIIYMDEESIIHGYYYFAYQIRNLDFQLISGCPQALELNSAARENKTLVLASSCPKTVLQPEIIYTDINN